MEMKYICWDNGGFDEIIVFSSHRPHDVMAGVLNIKRDAIRSAGFVTVRDDGGVQCYGRSHGLGVAAHPDDTALLNRNLGKDN